MISALIASTFSTNAHALSLSVSISPTSATISTSGFQMFTSTVSGGTPQYYYTWTVGSSPVSHQVGTFEFIPPAVGTYQVTLTITDSSSGRATSNTATVNVIACAGGIAVDPASFTWTYPSDWPGEKLTAWINVTNVQNLYTFQCGFHFNQSLIQVISVEDGGFLTNNVPPAQSQFIPGTIDNTTGTVTFYAITLFPTATPASSSGHLLKVNMEINPNLDLGVDQTPGPLIWFDQNDISTQTILLNNNLVDITPNYPSGFTGATFSLTVPWTNPWSTYSPPPSAGLLHDVLIACTSTGTIQSPSVSKNPLLISFTVVNTAWVNVISPCILGNPTIQKDHGSISFVTTHYNETPGLLNSYCFIYFEPTGSTYHITIQFAVTSVGGYSFPIGLAALDSLALYLVLVAVLGIGLMSVKRVKRRK